MGIVIFLVCLCLSCRYYKGTSEILNNIFR